MSDQGAAGGLAKSDPLDAAYELVYTEAIRSWTQQEASLDELRSRTGVLVAAATVAASFLGAAALGKPFQRLDVVALALFGIAVALSLVVLFPLPVWSFAMDINVFLDEIVEKEPTPTLAEIHRHVSLEIAKAQKRNDSWLHGMFVVFDIAVVAILLMVWVWAWAFLSASGVTPAPF